jgi:hypothetical protein
MSEHRSRGRKLLEAQRTHGQPLLGAPPGWMTTSQVGAWNDIVAASPVRLILANEPLLQITAECLATFRAGRPEAVSVRMIYRMLGDFFVPMRDRRRFLFPTRVKAK